MLELKNISLSFDKELIKNGELCIQDHQITLLSGASGSGKSSLLYDMAFYVIKVKWIISLMGKMFRH